MVHALRNFMTSQRGLVILGVALIGITIALPLIYAQTSNTRSVTAGTATDVTCAAACISTTEIEAGAVTGGAAGVISDGTIVNADISAIADIVGTKLLADTINGDRLADTIVLDVLTTIDTTTNAGANLEIGTAATAAGIKAILTGSSAAAQNFQVGLAVTVTGAAAGDVAYCSGNAADVDDNVSVTVGQVTTNTVTVNILDEGGAGTTTSQQIFCIVFDIT